jgi:hypothetical protein
MTYADRIRRTTITLGILTILTGLVGFYLARDIAFDAGRGVETLYPTYEVHGMTYNRLSALIVLGLGLVGLAAGLTRKPIVAIFPAVGFLILAGQVLLQWRDQAGNVLASTGQNLAFSLTMAVGFGAMVLFSRLGTALDRP